MKQLDQLPALKVKLTNRDQSIMVMPIGTTATFRLLRRGVVIRDNVAALVDVAAGTLTYDWLSTDLALVGEYLGEFTLTFPPDSKVQRVPKEDHIRIRVGPKL